MARIIETNTTDYYATAVYSDGFVTEIFHRGTLSTVIEYAKTYWNRTECVKLHDGMVETNVHSATDWEVVASFRPHTKTN